ncbi:MAG: NADH-dependent [FeFe] hydrogenase, group A6 [Desulfotomaculales bacterium]
MGEKPAGDTVTLWIDGRQVTAAKGASLVDAARAHGVDIPTLCYLPGISRPTCCRVCLVEIEGIRNLQPACIYPVREGLKVHTNTARVRRARRRMVELLLSEHYRECPTCVRAETCELRQLANRLGVREVRSLEKLPARRLDNRNPFIVRDYAKCIRCRRCEAVCRNLQEVGALAAAGRGRETVITPVFGRDLGEVACISCGQCVMVCPTGALTEREYIDQVWAALDDAGKFVVVQTAPPIQVTLGEAFGLPVGTIVTGQLAAALRRLGFDRVFSTDFAADLTIVEEAHEFLERLDGKGKLPLISSCSPGWVKFCEHFYPEFLDNLSTCKSPQEMMGALTKTYFAQKEGLDPDKLVVVAIMPCTAKKFEAARPEMVTEGRRDMDYVLTTRELARMIRQAGIRFKELPNEEYDAPLGMATGAGVIFGTTGGVMEAAIRTAIAITEGDVRAEVEFRAIRGLRGVKEAEVTVKGRPVRIAVAHGTRNARRVLERLRAGATYHFIEIMACPGGCIGGGGQPIYPHKDVAFDYRRKRAEALYRLDLSKEVRRAHENPAVKKIYEEFLGHPLSEKAKKLLHTTYTPRGRVPGVRPQAAATPPPAEARPPLPS